MKKGLVPKSLRIVDIQQAFNAVWQAISTPSIADLPSMTLAQLNGKITDANVDDDGDPRVPTVHASSHFPGASDDLIGMLVVEDTLNGLVVEDTNKTILMWSK